MLLLIPAIPLAGAVFLLIFRAKVGRFAGAIASSAIGGSFFVSLIAWSELLNRPAESRAVGGRVFEWIAAGSFHADFTLRVDPLTAVMLLVVTGVGTLIHIYSIGYMASDERRGTFFGYLNLFAASMLVLVLAGNFLVLFLGWELVGLCSFLLISFWSHRPSAAAAGKKAFIVNRIGDFGFLIALFLIQKTFGTLDMVEVFARAGESPLTGSLATAIPLLLLLGCAGKSAQIPLYIWLPDAMEGPTPVSALIHAATMVTAGVYLVARAHVLFEQSLIAGGVVVGIGIATALLAAAIAISQDDIKRVLAYSTVSQLGYMFVAVGTGALSRSALPYVAGIFHLVTHAFFKALLFLGAGSVMHAVGDETDMKKMGGLRKALPVTSLTFIIGWLAISGVPPLSGFFSKESILAAAWEHGLPWIWVLGVIVAGMTAFYMSRQVFLTFFGESRVAADVHPHESPPVMTRVLQSLALLAAVGGLLNLTLHHGTLSKWLEPVFTSGVHIEATEAATPLGLPEVVVSAFIALVSLAAIALAYRLYLAPGAEKARTRLKGSLGYFVRLSQKKFFVDELYNSLFVWPGKVVARIAAFGIDAKIIDGAVNGAAKAVGAAALRMRMTQSGLVRRYAMAMLTGAALIVALFVVRVR
ncbi:MAG TPA: NADH-quinone oxidoreductase subunit L [Actinomycetota bacterium]|nr:NADH-quinone oxidoreductase subunit L [Actinomycetota bacterium]